MIFYVKSLDEENIEENIINLINIATKYDDIILDFSKMYKVRSFEMLLFLINIIQLKQKGKNITVEMNSIGEQAHGAQYAKNMKLCDAIKDPSSITGYCSDNFSTITRVDYDFLYSISSKGCDWRTGLIEYSEKLSNILIKDNDILMSLLSYCIREIIRNTLEHNFLYQKGYAGQLCNVYIAAQNHYKQKKIELVFADNGVGIKRTLEDSGFSVKNSNDSNFLKIALKPGVSSQSNVSKRTQDLNESQWNNSGFGLYMTSEIMKKIGNFKIYSYNGGLKVDNTGIHDIAKDGLYIPGTIIKLEVDSSTRLEQNSKDVINELVNKGESMAQEDKSAIKTASKMSKMLY